MLEDENARLKGDLAFFESLLPMPANAKGVVIRSFRVQADSEPNSLRYRLLVQQSGRPERDFVGAVTLTVNLQQGGRPAVLQLPDPALPSAGPAPLSFRHYQRLEGNFSVPAGATVRSVLVRIRQRRRDARAADIHDVGGAHVRKQDDHGPEDDRHADRSRHRRSKAH